jgi:putative FmdB family regulatory protein
MPTYVYECRKCGHRFEILQSITDPPRKRCPECRGAVRRVLMPGGGLIFHGSGFYITDYKQKEVAAKEAASRSAAAKEAGGKANEAGKEGGKEAAKEAVKGTRKPPGPGGTAKPADGGAQKGT